MICVSSMSPLFHLRVINAGKSKCNEDQARAETLYVRRMPSRRDSMPGRAIPRSPAPDEPVANGTPPQMGQPPSAQGSPPCVVSSPSSPLTFSCFEEVVRVVFVALLLWLSCIM